MNSVDNNFIKSQQIGQGDDASVEKSQEFKSAIFDRICEEFDFAEGVRFINRGDYCEFDMTYYNFWIEIYMSDGELNLWLVSKTKYKPFELEVRDQNYEFQYSENRKGYHYYKNEDIFKYDYSDEEQFRNMLNDIFDILPQSQYEGN